MHKFLFLTLFTYLFSNNVSIGTQTNMGNYYMTPIVIDFDTHIAGFQFIINGTDIFNANGGLADENGFNVSVNSTDSIIGFSFTGAVIPAGQGDLVFLSHSNDITNGCLEDIIFSDSTGQAINVNNLNDNLDCLGECNGSAILDECGVCSGPGAVYECGCYDIPDDQCDCEGNIEDCLGECGGSATFDECIVMEIIQLVLDVMIN